MDDLREPKDRLGEKRVEAMDEDQRLTLRRLGDARVEAAHRLLLIERIGAQRDEFVGGIAGQGVRPLHLADLARAIRRNGDRDIGEGEAFSALAGEEIAGLRALGAACRGDEQFDARRPGHPRLRGQHPMRTPAAAARREGEAQGENRQTQSPRHITHSAKLPIPE